MVAGAPGSGVLWCSCMTNTKSTGNQESLLLSPKLFSYQVDHLGTANLEEREESKESSSGIPCKRGATAWSCLEDSSQGWPVPSQQGTLAYGFACHKPVTQQLSSWVSVETNSGRNR